MNAPQALAAKHWFCKPARSAHFRRGAPCAAVAQLVEHVLGKDEVSGSIPLSGSNIEKNI